MLAEFDVVVLDSAAGKLKDKVNEFLLSGKP